MSKVRDEVESLARSVLGASADDIQFLFAEPGEDSISEGLRLLTKALHVTGAANGERGGLFGGDWGYGANFENDTFLLHRYCWCERDDCPWCAGCQNNLPSLPHGPQCYQSRLELLRQRHGTKEEWGWHVPSDHPKYEREKRALCSDLGVNFELGNEVHCTCGADAEWRRQFDACQCAWHLGRDQFRWPATSAPNFWHKPTGFRVNWYKYIGRGVEVAGDSDDWPAILLDCLHSIGVAEGDDR